RCEKQILEVSLVNVEPSPKTANLGEVGAILKQLKFLVTPDTSLVHLAACYDLSVIALYRNNRADIERFPPMSTLHELVVSPNELVGSISVDAVDKAVRRMIEALPIAPEVV
ncbi:MAG TPA: glycosyltransferase family 9 protein, partial [Chlorobaculum sp.]|nr:glycosyltransferase family 9 protein [Chlorobaculum sp.]